MHDKKNRVANDDVVLSPGNDASQTRRIQEAVDACAARGGGRVVLQAGQYRAGTIILRNGVTLHLEQDAVLKASGNLADYHRRAYTGAVYGSDREGPQRTLPTAMIFAEGAERIGLTGKGTLDGNGEAFYRSRGPSDPPAPAWVAEKKPLGTWIPAFNTMMLQPERPRDQILLVDCRQVRVENLTIRNSAQWTLHLLACTDVIVRGITLHTPVDCPNGDGIDLDGCSDALIEACDITTGDDAVCLKNTNMWGYARLSRNITVRNCRLRATAHAFCIGTETQADFENIVLDGLQIGSYDGYGLTGIGLSMLEGHTLRGVRVSNIEMRGIMMPFYVRLGTECRGVTRPAGAIEDVVFENVTASGVTGNSFMTGQPGHPLRNIRMRNVRIAFAGAIDPAMAMQDVPLLETEYADNRIWQFLPSYGLFCRLIEGLELTRVDFTTTPAEKRPALLIRDVGDIQPTA